MIFISLRKMRKKPTKEVVERATQDLEALKSKGVKIIDWYWTLGRFDIVLIYEAPSEKEALKVSLAVENYVSSETLVAMSREEAIKLL